MSLAKYRVIDLSLITIVGVVTEIVGCYLVNYFIPSVVPVFVASFVICYLAIIRWGAWGLIEIPIMALATYIAVTFIIPFTQLNEGKEQLVQNYLSILVFDLTNVVWLIFRVDKNGKLVLDTLAKRVGMMILMYIVSAFLCAVILTIFKQNVFISFLRLLSQQLLALFITCFVIEILQRFNAVYDVKKNFLKQKQEKIEETEYENEYYNKSKKE